ncbi:MAG: lasso RiPP family leader peptide-containing protein [Acidimicrobiia bacterium]|nr:lasso RiPP family leader peptide-containing protein [Acidimicrobiia bacterium]MBT8216339.1 lasso RiPP family leader peptide-containing protein [Acidimicrobiia bacterium]NNF08997.1 lasso RiPP family leader peptide-containing protein [Acidimicrobiia bacterium]NNL71546.1 lasso RiPP family leader peptide-containing protein [Acidimicrobiia bacterium]
MEYEAPQVELIGDVAEITLGDGSLKQDGN